MSSKREYRLDYDAEFEEMLKRLKNAKFHSSLIESENDDTGFESGSASLEWSPTLSPIIVEDSPKQDSSPLRKSKPSKSRSLDLADKQQLGIKVENIVIDLGSDCESSSDESETDSGPTDLNATYTAKTMGRKRLSHMLDVLQEIEIENDLQSSSPASPCTPINTFKPLPEPSYRLIHVGGNNVVTSNCISENNVTVKKLSPKQN